MAEEAKYMTEEDKKDKQYERLIEARNFHYENLNKWLTFFYVAVGAVFAGYCTLSANSPCSPMLEVILIVGYLISLAGYLSCKGYYYWEKNWIMLVQYYENTYLKDSKAGKVKEDKELLFRNRTYSVFANVKDLDKPWGIRTSANVSTTKVALVLTFIITSVFGTILLYEVMPFMEEVYNWTFSAILSAFLTWIIAGYIARIMRSIDKKGKIDDLELPVD